MVEQEINVELAVTHLQVILATDESEALSEFQQETFQLVQEIGFQFAFVEWFLRVRKSKM